MHKGNAGLFVSLMSDNEDTRGAIAPVTNEKA
jgi:hypothetical protein